MSSNTVALTINNLSKEIKKIKGIKDRQKGKYLSDLDKLNEQYKDLELPDYFTTQYNQLNKKGNELLRDIRGGKHADNVANDIPIYIRYLKASLMDFEGKTNNIVLSIVYSPKINIFRETVILQFEILYYK